LKKDLRNFTNYRDWSIPPKSKFNGFAGEPIITAMVTSIPNEIPTITNLIFINYIQNAQIKRSVLETAKICDKALK